MPKFKLILSTERSQSCPDFPTLFNTEFEVESTVEEDEFLNRIQEVNADAAMVCFCSAKEEDVERLLRLDALAGPVPVLSCSKILNPDFVCSAVRQGFEGFLQCTMEEHKIVELVYNAVRRGGLRGFLEPWCEKNQLHSAKVRKMIDEIIHNFPHRMQEDEMARRLGISRGWLQKLCQKCFGRSYTKLLRRIWMHQALYMMQHTTLNNTEIAVQLNYSEERSLAARFSQGVRLQPQRSS